MAKETRVEKWLISWNFIIYIILFFKDCIYLVLERGEGRERNINVREIQQSVASCAPNWGPGLQPRRVL